MSGAAQGRALEESGLLVRLMAEAQVHLPGWFLVHGSLGLKAGNCAKGHDRLGVPKPFQSGMAGADFFKQALSMQGTELILGMSGTHRSVGSRGGDATVLGRSWE